MRELPLFWRYWETGQYAQLKPRYLWLQPPNWLALGVLHYLFPHPQKCPLHWAFNSLVLYKNYSISWFPSPLLLNTRCSQIRMMYRCSSFFKLCRIHTSITAEAAGLEGSWYSYTCHIYWFLSGQHWGLLHGIFLFRAVCGFCRCGLPLLAHCLSVSFRISLSSEVCRHWWSSDWCLFAGLVLRPLLCRQPSWFPVSSQMN